MPFDHRVPSSDLDPLVIGFVPTIDAAILIAAYELGLFAQHGLSVALSRETGWATIREKLLHDEVHAAHAPASLAFVLRCGLGTVARPCLTGFVLALNGSAITLSRELWEKGVRDAASLCELVQRERGTRKYRLGAVFQFSTQHYELLQWLRSGGIDPEKDVLISIIPSTLIHHSLLAGHLDGYCVAEPWNTVLTESGEGWVVATSSQLAPGQPETVFLVLESFAEEQPEQHLSLLAALMEASAFCEEPANRRDLIRMLAEPAYLNVPESSLTPSLEGAFPLRTAQAEPQFITFKQGSANVPDREKGRRVFEEVQQMPAAQGSRALRPDVVRHVFRKDLYDLAQKRVGVRPACTPLDTRAPTVALALAG